MDSQPNKLHHFFIALIYSTLALAVYTQCFSFRYNNNAINQKLNNTLYKIPLLINIPFSHLAVFVLLLPVAASSMAKKEINFDMHRHFWYSFIPGSLFFVLSLYIPSLQFSAGDAKVWLYVFLWLTGTILLHTAITNLTKILFYRIKDDIWNNEEEAFEQNTQLLESPLMFNLPILFYFKRKIKKGWMNIDPFRGIMVLGVPGSGKSESVIVPFIKQMLAKGFAMLVYDFKFPDLGKITYYHYLKNNAGDGPLKNHVFHCINVDSIEHSQRINPLLSQYIQTLSDANETAEAIVSSLQKSDKSSGAQQFFTQSAVNFLAATIFFFAKYKKGKYSTFPHVLAFLSQSYEKIFTTLFSDAELQSLLAPFKSAYDNKAFDQLEGQIGTLRINTSRLVTKETFFVFSGNDFDLKISNPASVIVLANNPSTQSINSAFYATVLLRTTRLINSKGNTPSALVIDETPTIFLHKIENLIATARSNKVAVVLGLQELPQLFLHYSKEIADTITSIMGTVLSGAVRNKETLSWLEKLTGQIKQIKKGVSIDREKTNTSINENMGHLIPAAKIASQNAGEMVGIVAKETSVDYEEFRPNVFRCKIELDFKEIDEEKKRYPDLPKFYDFGTPEQKESFLKANMESVFKEVETL